MTNILVLAVICQVSESHAGAWTVSSTLPLTYELLAVFGGARALCLVRGHSGKIKSKGQIDSKVWSYTFICYCLQECFLFSVYTSQYQFGSCREWIDQSQMGTSAVHHTPARAQQCRACHAHSNCSSCLRTLGCGWCFVQNNPVAGTCVRGDFTNPQEGTLSPLITSF